MTYDMYFFDPIRMVFASVARQVEFEALFTTANAADHLSLNRCLFTASSSSTHRVCWYFQGKHRLSHDFLILITVMTHPPVHGCRCRYCDHMLAQEERALWERVVFRNSKHHWKEAESQPQFFVVR